MKIILTGATGVVGTECIRIALAHPQITEVVALSRRPLSQPDNTPAGTDKSKLKTVILEDFGSEYPQAVVDELKGADACIWNLAITPTKAKGLSPEVVKTICHDYTHIGLKAMASVANSNHPFRFVYTSGALVERDQSKSLWLAPEIRKMRGAVDASLVSYAASTNGKVEVQIPKPGLVDHTGRGTVFRAAASAIGVATATMTVNVSELAAVELDQAIRGFAGKETLENAEVVTMGRGVLKDLGVKMA